jgi:hypothetical protein
VAGSPSPRGHGRRLTTPRQPRQPGRSTHGLSTDPVTEADTRGSAKSRFPLTSPESALRTRMPFGLGERPDLLDESAIPVRAPQERVSAAANQRPPGP